MSIDLRTPALAQAILSADDYRRQRAPVDGYRLLRATVTITLLEDPHRARYEYDCHLETTGDVPARYWCYELPADFVEVGDVRAWDARGILQPHVVRGEGGGSRLDIRLRDSVRKGDRYAFGFSYDTGIRPVVAGDGRKRVVTFADWVIFNIPCTVLQVYVELPRAAAPVQTMPASAEDEGWRMTYRVCALRPLESASFMIAYRRTHRPHAGALLRGAGLMADGFLGSGYQR